MTFTVSGFAVVAGITEHLAEVFLDGCEGFVDKGLVLRVDDGYVVTANGWALARSFSEHVAREAA